MAAPLPLRFYNPVKELCKKVNLDYETVIGTGLSPAMREAFICAEIQKPIEEIKAEDKKFIKHKKEFFNRKYGGELPARETGTGEVEDKGRVRYDMGVNVEYICAESREVDESSTPPSSMATITTTANTGSDFAGVAGTRRAAKWVPGRPAPSR